jgi:hypothetical protein
MEVDLTDLHLKRLDQRELTGALRQMMLDISRRGLGGKIRFPG